MSRQRWAIQGLALAMGVWVLSSGSRAADAPGQVIPDADYPKMLKYGVKGIQDSLKGTPKDELIIKARTAALMVAAYAQENLQGAEGQQRATVRDAALKIADAIDAKKYAEASKQASELASLKANPAAKKEKIKLIDDRVKFKDLMNQFNHPPEGGWGIHREFYQYQLGMKGIPATSLADPLLLKAYQVGVTAELMNDKTPSKNQKEWATYAGDLKAGALELAEAVRAKDGKAGVTAITKVTTSCTSCHKIFGGGPK
jgi:hypothetical protein